MRSKLKCVGRARSMLPGKQIRQGVCRGDKFPEQHHKSHTIYVCKTRAYYSLCCRFPKPVVCNLRQWIVCICRCCFVPKQCIWSVPAICFTDVFRGSIPCTRRPILSRPSFRPSGGCMLITATRAAARTSHPSQTK